MSEVLASLKKVGGNGEQYTETVLWTNPSPTASFTAQNVTLSDSLSNYKYIGIKFAYGTSYNTGEYLTTILLTVADFRKGGYNTSVRRNNMALGIISDANKSHDRTVYYVDDTSVRFGTCYQVGSNTTANNNAIPLEILGVNELKGGSGLKTPFVFVVRCPQSTSYGQSVMLAENYNQYTYMRTMSQAEVNSWWGRTDITVATSVTLSESSGTTTIQETTLTTSPVLISSLNFVDTNMIWAQVRGTACAIMLYD